MAYDHLRTLLKKHGKSQKDLAAKLDRSDGVITNLFNGTRRLELDEAVVIAKWLKEPLAEIAGYDDSRETSGIDEKLYSVSAELAEAIIKKKGVKPSNKQYSKLVAEIYSTLIDSAEWKSGGKINLSDKVLELALYKAQHSA